MDDSTSLRWHWISETVWGWLASLWWWLIHGVWGYRLGSQGVVMLIVYMYILVVGGTSKDDTSKDGTSKDGTSKIDTSKDGTCCMRPLDHNSIMTRFNTQSFFLCAIWETWQLKFRPSCWLTMYTCRLPHQEILGVPNPWCRLDSDSAPVRRWLVERSSVSSDSRPTVPVVFAGYAHGFLLVKINK